jgi:hypothetical protein
MRWFGEKSGAAFQRQVPKDLTPVGAKCVMCGVDITAADSGVILPFSGSESDPPEVPAHMPCFLESIGCHEAADQERAIKKQPN